VPTEHRLRTRSPAETESLGGRIGATLGPGDVVLVSGELGAGKTTLIRGACRGLGVTEPIVSPTFTIGRRYRGRLPVSHVDLYRLEGLGGEDPGLLDDYLTPDAVTFVEWPAAAAGLLESDDRDEARVVLRVELAHAGGDEREIAVEDERERPG
jgi:tRNA threonylcarbamoyladenosine biosynthesis protein TsaE